ncbi:MAG: hypothetical protein A3F72_02300 [Bacteroidetes bacterium RIFCSPLOWO2_12_FULL_35_15]|nr:MAG: hypothetical protein A3F72_02300 [Bacteroidetes bacterium RIFCSPLOWO2_12_FULL_35_15]
MKIFKIATLLILFLNTSIISAQENTDNEIPVKSKGFHFGLYVGSYFANKYTANLYDGYGYDIDGKRNNFINSFMYNKIILEYGGGYSGTVDQVAQALNVDPGAWTFNESDMPTNLKYTPAFLLGLQSRYTVDKKNAILINVNATKLNVSANFTITTTPPTGSTQINKSIRTFAIRGEEQRLMFQFGYNRILGDNEKVNFYVEGGLNITLAKFSKNDILINNETTPTVLHIDLTESYSSINGYNAYVTKKPIGTGFGLFSGLGINFSMSPSWTVQLGYNPSFERINIGENPRLKFQHAIGIRAYYKF